MRRVEKPNRPVTELLGVPDPIDPPGPTQVPLTVADAQLRQALDGIHDPQTRRQIANDRFGTRLDAEAARNVLLREQRGLCAFCEGRVTAAPHHHAPRAETNMRIAHWQPRFHHPERALDWQNLFGSCDMQHRRAEEQHCDYVQGSYALPEDAPTPACADYSQWLRLSASGALQPLETAPPFVQRVIDLFHLNTPTLCDARRSAVAGLLRDVPARDARGRRGSFELLLANLTRPRGVLPPYVTAMRLRLQRELAR